VKHYAGTDFWVRYHALQGEVRAVADRAFAMLKAIPGIRRFTQEGWSVLVRTGWIALSGFGR